MFFSGFVSCQEAARRRRPAGGRSEEGGRLRSPLLRGRQRALQSPEDEADNPRFRNCSLQNLILIVYILSELSILLKNRLTDPWQGEADVREGGQDGDFLADLGDRDPSTMTTMSTTMTTRTMRTTRITMTTMNLRSQLQPDRRLPRS